jgi:hypothetical protein
MRFAEKAPVSAVRAKSCRLGHLFGNCDTLQKAAWRFADG